MNELFTPEDKNKILTFSVKSIFQNALSLKKIITKIFYMM